MKRREFIGLNSAAVAAAGLSAANIINTASAEQPASDQAAVGNPMLVNPDVNLMGVAWRVHQLSNGMVEYGKTKQLGQTAVASRHGLRQADDAALLVELRDLEPNTTYFYRTVTTALDFATAKYKNVPNRGNPRRSEIFQFRTPPVKSEDASFAVINDTHGVTPVIEALFDKLQKDPADAVIWNGDWGDLTAPELVTEYTVDALGPKKYATRTPIVFAYGNHDVRGQYAMDMEKVIPKREGRRYFTFQNGPVQFMVLDTGEDKPDSHEYLAGLTDFENYRSEQRQWIAQQIEREAWNSAKFRVIICHIPLFGPWNCPDGRTKWHDLLVKGKADLMISGHTHQHHWHAPTDERPYPLLVGGGPQAREATLIRGQVKAGKMQLQMEMLNGDPVLETTLEARS